MQLNDWLTTTLAVLSIALTILGVALTILGVLIAIIAVWGYRAIKQEARAIADTAAKQQIATYLTSEQIQVRLKEEIRKRVGQEADQLFKDLLLPFAFPQAEEETRPIGAEYPGDNVARSDQ